MNFWIRRCGERRIAVYLDHERRRDRLATLFANVDAFLHPNPREPFGIAPLEAMAAGTPLVAPNSGGVTAYAHAGNAWLSEPTGEGFARSILDMAETRMYALRASLRHGKRRCNTVGPRSARGSMRCIAIFTPAPRASGPNWSRRFTRHRAIGWAWSSVQSKANRESRCRLEGWSRVRPTKHLFCWLRRWFLGCMVSPPSLMDDVDAVQGQIALNMLDSGDWVTPHLNGIAYMEKAPLKYWMMAVAFQIFGVHDWASRIPVRGQLWCCAGWCF